MFPNQRANQRSDADAQITAALRGSHVEARRPSQTVQERVLGTGHRCRLCRCNIDADPDADRKIGACGSCKTRPEASRLRNLESAGAFTEAEKSLIRKVHGYLPALQLLGILNDRLRADLGPDAQPYTAEQLHNEIAAIPGAKPGGDHGWAGLRKLLAQAKRVGTLDQITDQVINDFAVVFSLSPKHLMRLKDILLQPAED